MSVQEPLARRPTPDAPAPAGHAAAPTANEAAEEGAVVAEAHPRGALLISVLYVAVLGLLWGFMYVNNVRAG